MTIYRHTANGSFPGEEWTCTFHTEGTLDLTAAQAAWVAAWSAAWSGLSAPTDNINQLIATDVSTTSLVTSSLDPVTFRQVAKAEDDVDLAGTSDGASLPPQCAAGITWESALANRHGRGRMYLPVYASSSVGAGRLLPANVEITLNAAGNIYTTLTAAGASPIIFNRTTHVGTLITSARVGDVFNTQRKRRDKLVPAYQSTTF